MDNKKFKQLFNDATLTTDESIAQAVAKYQIFGRVTPDQKLKFVEALKAQGRTVEKAGAGNGN